MIKTITKATLSTGNSQKLVVHIVERTSPGGSLKDTALCGKMWDRMANTAKDLCEECEEIAAKNGHDWRAR